MLRQRTTPTVPPARAVRARLRRLRRRHRTGSLWDVLSDAYVVVLSLAAIALSLASGLNSFLTSPAVLQQGSPATRYWIAVAATVAAAGGLSVAATAAVPAQRALVRVDRGSLATGAQVFRAATSATVLVDASLLTGLLEIRRWQRRGRVRHRPFRPASRYLVLLQAEVRRLLRHPSALPAWGVLLLAMYAIGVALPPAAGASQVVLAFLAAGRLTGGLRTVSRSATLRRAIGGSDTGLRLVHLVIPAVATAVWYVLSLPVVPVAFGWLDALVLAGVVGAAYREATRPPVQYGGIMVESPAGLIPIDILSHSLRGTILIAFLAFLQGLR